MPSGSFLSSSLSCAPVAVEPWMDTSATFVAGPMPQPSILPIRLSGDVAGFDSGMRGLAVLPSPSKMPSGVGAGGAPGNMSPPGTGGVPPSPPNDPPLVGAGAGARGGWPGIGAKGPAGGGWGRWGGWRGPSGGGHGRGQHDKHVVEVATRERELGPQTPPCGVFILARMGLQVFHAAHVDGDLALGAQAQDALFHRGFAEPGNAILPRRARLLKLAQQFAQRRVFAGGLQHEVLEV